MNRWYRNLGVILLICFYSQLSAQCNSNDPYKLYWKNYVLEFDSSQIALNKIQAIKSKKYLIKKNKQTRERQNFDVKFNENYLPIMYIDYDEFGLRKGLIYNPIWRMRHEYPLYSVRRYELKYNEKNQLIQVTEKEKRAFAKDTSYTELKFMYDSLERVILQVEYKVIYFTINLNGQDSIFEAIDHVDSISYRYNGNNTGDIIVSHYIKDTIHWKNSPVNYYKFNFGDNKTNYIRNIPYDRNTSIFYAIDTNSIIEFNENGLRKSKITVIGENITKDIIVKLEKYNISTYEYFYRKEED